MDARVLGKISKHITNTSEVKDNILASQRHI